MLLLLIIYLFIYLSTNHSELTRFFLRKQYLITIISSSLSMNMSLTNILWIISWPIQVFRQEKYWKVELENAWYGCSMVREVYKNIVCVRVKGNMNWECNSGRVKMSLHTHTLETKAEERMCPLTSFFYSLSFSCMYTLHILLFHFSYLLKIHLSPSLYIWLTR